MRVISIAVTAAAAALLFTGSPATHAATPQITCSQLPDAQRFVDGLHPGPNTSAAQKHLDAAKQASDAGDQGHCVSELGRVNYYASRSANADKHAAAHPASAHHARRRHVLCADAMHQNRPGGTDYHGPAVPGCRRPPV
ncbi:MAG TPA: hypothetical protein VG328_11295 [Stellaceae bacterium]|jgi:hypothetical protein|nr:hypothetical protein [Stellaceae bacterium]